MDISHSQLAFYSSVLRELQKETRKLAKEKDIRIRKHRWSGVDIKLPDGSKHHCHGWIEANRFVKRFERLVNDR